MSQGLKPLFDFEPVVPGLKSRPISEATATTQKQENGNDSETRQRRRQYAAQSF
jgi:hypothetical protein